jgi:hypothetical protein
MLRFLGLSICSLRMRLVAREYSQKLTQMLYQAYEQNDIKTVVLFE